MPNFIPRSDVSFDIWFDNFANYISANYVALGLTLQEKNDIVALNVTWNTKYAALLTAKLVVKSALEDKDTIRESSEAKIRFLAKRIRGYTPVTDAILELLGLTPLDKEPTPLSEDIVKTLLPPVLIAKPILYKTVEISFGVNPQNEKENAKPEDIYGARIWYKIEGTGLLDGWMLLADDTNSPYIHYATTMTISYKAAWFDRRMRVGPTDDSVTVAVTA